MAHATPQTGTHGRRTADFGARAARSVQRAVARTHDRGAALASSQTGVEARSARQRTQEMRRHGIGSQFSMLIRGAVLLAVGVFITGAIFAAIPDQNGALGGARTEVENLTGQAFEIAPVVLIVLVAVLILQFVRDL